MMCWCGPNRHIVLCLVPQRADSADGSGSDDDSDARDEPVELGEGAYGKVFKGKFAHRCHWHLETFANGD